MKARTASGLVRIAVITTTATATAKTPLSDFSGQQSIVKNPEKKEFCSIKKGFQNKDKKIGGGGGSQFMCCIRECNWTARLLKG